MIVPSVKSFAGKSLASQIKFIIFATIVLESNRAGCLCHLLYYTVLTGEVASYIKLSLQNEKEQCYLADVFVIPDPKRRHHQATVQLQGEEGNKI